MPDFSKSSGLETGFPSIQWEDEELDTRPMPMHERPMQARVDAQLFTRQLSVDFLRSVPILCGWKKKTDAS